MAMHRINRSEVELHTGDAALARALLDQIGRIYGPRIAPVIDRVCSELSASEAPVRIDRLEVDLGTVAADDVEGAFVARLESVLRTALQDALKRRTGGGRGARDSLELLETFALTGGLPWWAPPDREVVARHFARASAEAGAELVALLGRIAQDPGALDRIARLCGRSTLAALVERAQAGSPPVSPRIADDPARRRQPRDPGRFDDPRAGARDIGDREPTSHTPAVDDAMAVASSGGPQRTDDEARRQQQVDRTSLGKQQSRARDVGDGDPLRRRQWAELTSPGESTPLLDVPAIDGAVAAVSSAASPVMDGEPRRRPPSRSTELDEPPAGVRDIGPRAPVASPEVPAVDDAPAASSAGWPLAEDEPQHPQPAERTLLDEEHAYSRDLDRRTPASPGLPEGGAAMAAASVAASPVSDGRALDARRAGPTLDPPRPPAQPRLDGGPGVRAAARTSRAPAAPTDAAANRARRGALARLDELYVDDAGLVILWPFLERFFVRTGVLGEDRRFLDEPAQLQAVALVASLATADPAPLEFRLPLAKLLCGRSLESDFALERPLAPEQLAEADRLLAAAIDRVPALDEPSIAEFRAGFLARPGALGARDGAWLLQVERRPHDTVLDRFPWSWRWVRLPWMTAPLRVEW